MAEIKVTILVDEGLIARAKTRAARERTTVSDVVRAFLEEWAAGEQPRVGSRPPASGSASVEQRREVVSQYNAGADVGQIAKNLGLSIEDVGRILRDNRQQKGGPR